MTAISQVRTSAGFRLMVLFGSFFVCLILTSAVAVALGLIPGIGERCSLLTASTVQCLLAFCLPAWLTARYASERPWHFLGVTQAAPLKSFAGVVIVYILALPAMNQIIAWNEAMHFPDWASGLEQGLRDMEAANASVAEKLLKFNGFGSFFVTALVVGLFTGFSEELFFRGALQNVFQDGGMRKAVAIWSAAAIFSAFHFQFFGFVPRMLMGAFFGYLLVWTGSLWPAVFAHFLNNTSVVAAAYFIGGENAEAFGDIDRLIDSKIPVAAIMSAAATVFFFIGFGNYFFKKHGKVAD